MAPADDGDARKERSREELERENELLRKQIAELKATNLPVESAATVPEISSPLLPVDKLSRDDIGRYSRQLLLSNGFGVEGQKKLLSSSVLVVGAGGIGSTGG